MADALSKAGFPSLKNFLERYGRKEGGQLNLSRNTLLSYYDNKRYVFDALVAQAQAEEASKPLTDDELYSEVESFNLTSENAINV